MLFFVAACFLPAFAVSLVATGLVRRVAPALGLIDQPAARKVHVTPTPLGGGIGIWIGVVLPAALAQGTVWWLTRSETLPRWIPAELTTHFEGVLFRSGQFWALLTGGTILAIMGLMDDRWDLPWKPRLAVQFCVAAGAVAAGAKGTLFVSLPWLGPVISVIWILVFINSFNFLDNMDGLSAGLALIAAIFIAVIMLTMTSEPHWFVAGLSLILAGSLSGFLFHNRPPARIFMGDTGSHFIGYLIACLTILGTFYEYDRESRHVILAPLCILAIPLYDFCSVVLIRLMAGTSPFLPDKRHFSHRLVELGLSPTGAVLTIYLAAITTGLGAILLYYVERWSGASLILVLISCVLAIVAILETAGRRKKNQNTE